MAKEDLTGLSDEEFEKEWTQAAQDLEAAKERVNGFASEQRRREAKKVLDDMPEEQKRMLAQYVASEGIESREGVNGD